MEMTYNWDRSTEHTVDRIQSKVNLHHLHSSHAFFDKDENKHILLSAWLFVTFLLTLFLAVIISGEIITAKNEFNKSSKEIITTKNKFNKTVTNSYAYYF